MAGGFCLKPVESPKVPPALCPQALSGARQKIKRGPVARAPVGVLSLSAVLTYRPPSHFQLMRYSNAATPISAKTLP